MGHGYSDHAKIVNYHLIYNNQDMNKNSRLIISIKHPI